jgi:hypothetical protein
MEVPEWLTLWITDTSLEELDVDEKSVVRSILNDHVNKTITGKGEVPGLLHYRIDKIVDGEWWSFLRTGVKRMLIGKDTTGKPHFKEEPTDDCYINTSILEIFRETARHDFQEIL